MSCRFEAALCFFLASNLACTNVFQASLYKPWVQSSSYFKGRWKQESGARTSVRIRLTFMRRLPEADELDALWRDSLSVCQSESLTL
jgi:hypothetical protein